LPFQLSHWSRITGALCAAVLSASVLCAVPAPASASPPAAKGKSAKSKKKSVKSRRSRHAWRARGQKNIDEARARQIQQALIREGYLDGKPSGKWDARSKDAMTRYQADHGWQTRTVPDARALIKLGLGPANSTTVPAAPESGAAPSGGEKSSSTAARQR
jgi:peptidoglycan hydrolase-like protein with peptidoglycan-binding domain